MDIVKQLVSELEQGKIKDRKQLQKRKIELARIQKLNKWPQNTELFATLDKKQKEKFRKILQMKPTRTISGVAVVAVMSKPGPCPHGKCTYCPHIDNVPESYTGKEPAARRGIANKFDPYKQVTNRLEQLYASGHLPEKVELIIMGGTFPSYDRKYQKEFIKDCLSAMNDFTSKKKTPKSTSLVKVQKANEKAKIRCVGMTFETRPDFATEKHANFMLNLGGTRVELGVQTVYDDIYKRINRGHTVADVIKATRTLKNKGFKILYHMMLGLPGSNPEKDLSAFKEIFKNPYFRPDMLKIYPCLVIKGSELYNEWKEGKYKPYTENDAIKIIREFKKLCPEWVRIMRVERDIPSTEIVAGIKSTNLRQMLGKTECKCIRCREVGHRTLKGLSLDKDSICLDKIEYDASDGKEIFIQFIDKNKTLLGFLRLRLNETDNAFVRELHVYGEQIPIGAKGDVQHKGYGKNLLKEAEKIAKKAGKKKISVISGIGVKPYYYKFGYKPDGPYVSKKL